jgi:hypothetical protein
MEEGFYKTACVFTARFIYLELNNRSIPLKIKPRNSTKHELDTILSIDSMSNKNQKGVVQYSYRYFPKDTTYIADHSDRAV